MKINILGSSCSGKSTVSKKLSKLLTIDLIEIDRINWKLGNWVELSKEDLRKELSDILRDKESWIIDGSYGKVRDIVWQDVDIIIWLNFPFYLIMYRYFIRTIKRIISKEQLFGANNVETFRMQFFSTDSLFLWILKTFWSRKKRYEGLFEEQRKRGKKIIVVKSVRELDRVVNRLECS